MIDFFFLLLFFFMNTKIIQEITKVQAQGKNNNNLSLLHQFSSNKIYKDILTHCFNKLSGYPYAR